MSKLSHYDSLPSKGDIFLYWKDHLGQIGIFIDWGEPGCWACDFHYDTKYDIKHENATIDELIACWNRIPLQRCHIVPKSLGGSDDVSNLFLMCRECHDLAPNTLYPDIFYHWVRHQDWASRELVRFNNALETFASLEESELLAKVIASDEFRIWIRGKLGRHWPQSNYAFRSARLTHATLIGLAKYYLSNYSDTP